MKFGLGVYIATNLAGETRRRGFLKIPIPSAVEYIVKLITLNIRT